MLPQITKLEFESEEEKEVTDLGTSFLFDFKKGEFILSDGKMIKINGIEALKVWIEKIVKTERFRYQIYEGLNYGVGINKLIGRVLPSDFIESELRRELSEALLKHPLISSVNNIKTRRDEDKIFIELSVSLIDGKSFSQGVNYNYG